MASWIFVLSNSKLITQFSVQILQPLLSCVVPWLDGCWYCSWVTTQRHGNLGSYYRASPCTSITKEAEVREEAEVCDSFFPTVLLWDNIHYKETWYLVWQVYLPDTAVRRRIAGLGFLCLLPLE